MAHLYIDTACNAPCPEPAMILVRAIEFLLSASLRPPCPGLGACALVGALGGAPFCFPLFSSPFSSPLLVRESHAEPRLRTKLCGYPFGSSLRSSSLHKRSASIHLLRRRKALRLRQRPPIRDPPNYNILGVVAERRY